MATPRTVALHTLGCKLNYSESSQLGRQLEAKGYGIVPFRANADVYVINTCSVTDFADRKCRKAIRDARRSNPEGLVIVTGCYAQLKPEEIAQIDGVNLVLGAAEKWRMTEYIDELAHSPMTGMVHCGDIADHVEFSGSFSVKDRTRTFLKVQDGCDYKCSFCTIPQARGVSRSMPLDQVMTQISYLENESDVQEIVLTGINLGDYGILPDGTGKLRRQLTFLDLIREIDEKSSIPRFRISSIEPNLCDDEVIEMVAGSRRFMPHFHMPLQSGSPEMLRSMRRRYTRDLYTERVHKIKETMPHACIGVDVIVGYPGETDAHFADTQQYLAGLPIDYLHVFTYSERAGTPATEMAAAVPMHIRRERNSILRALSHDKKMAFYDRHRHSSRTVLCEAKSSDERHWEGYTDNYIRVLLDKAHHQPNELTTVQLCDITPEGLMTSSIAATVS